MQIVKTLIFLFLWTPLWAQEATEKAVDSTYSEIYGQEKNTPFFYSYHLEVKRDSSSAPYYKMLGFEFQDLPQSQAVLEMAQHFKINPNKIHSCLNLFFDAIGETPKYDKILIERLKFLATKPFEQGYGIVLVIGGNGECGRGHEALGQATHKFGFEYVCVSADCDNGNMDIAVKVFNEVAESIIRKKYGKGWEKKLEQEIAQFTYERASKLPPKPYNLYKKLIINKYQVAGLVKDFGDFKNLEELSLNDDFKEIPQELGRLKKLKKIVLGYGRNGFAELPDSICLLENLEEISTYDGILKKLPQNIGNLKKLKKLVLSFNKLTELPESICELSNLEFFSLWGNKIKKLPKNMGNLKKLSWISLDMKTLTKSEQIRAKQIFGHLLK